MGEARFQRLLARARPLDEDEIRRLSPMLILSPHQDDETLGCGGLIATAARLGLRPRVAYLTDGGASHVGSPHWTHERLACLRRREAIAALGDLGVPADDILFLGWRDGEPHPAGSVAHDEAVTALRLWTADRPVASIWSCWSKEAHCDHLATAEVAAACREASDPKLPGYAYIVWGWPEAALETEKGVRSLACPETIEARTRALARHESQVANIIADAEQAFQVPPELAAVTSRPFELYLELA